MSVNTKLIKGNSYFIVQRVYCLYYVASFVLKLLL